MPQSTIYFLKTLLSEIDFITDNMQPGFMDTSAWVGVVLDSDIITLEMDRDAEGVSTNWPETMNDRF